jgi:hypothetical protein
MRDPLVSEPSNPHMTFHCPGDHNCDWLLWCISLPLPQVGLSKPPMTEEAWGSVYPWKTKNPCSVSTVGALGGHPGTQKHDPRTSGIHHCSSVWELNIETESKHLKTLNRNLTFSQHPILCLLHLIIIKIGLAFCKSVEVFTYFFLVIYFCLLEKYLSYTKN